MRLFSFVILFASMSAFAIPPVKIQPITQFTCVENVIQTDAPKEYIFYFKPNTPPEARPYGSALVCHDVLNYGQVDSEEFPRLKEIPRIFNVWDGNDARFYDQNGDGYIDLQNNIQWSYQRYGGQGAALSLFFKAQMPGTPEHYENAGMRYSSAGLGWIMAPLIRLSDNISICPGRGEYNSGHPLMQALRDHIQLETEGLYYANSGAMENQDYVALRERDLKSVWFYMKNNVPTVVTEAVVSRVAVYFYYPLDRNQPLVKHPGQKIYRVRSAEEIGLPTLSSATGIPTHDRKVACIPKL